MIIAKKNKPDLKNMFDKFITELDRKEKEKEAKYQNAYMKYIINQCCSPREDDEDDDCDFDYNFDFEDYTGYGKSKKNWKKTRRLLESMGATSKHKKNKKETRRSGKKNKGKKESKIIATEDVNNRLIYFYRDVDDPDRVEMFFNLHDFDEYLEQQGINVSEQEVNALLNRETSFCTINPDIKKTNGTVQLISDGSYGGLYWACHEDEEIYSNC